MNQHIFSGLIVLGGVALLAAVLIISIPASYPSVPDYSRAVSLMTEHMQLHHKIDRTIDTNNQHGSK